MFSLVLWIIIIAQGAAFNLLVGVREARYLVSPLVRLYGIKNSSGDLPYLPSDVKPSYYGYSLTMINGFFGEVGLKVGSPKMIDPFDPSLQKENAGAEKEPKGTMKMCAIPVTFFNNPSLRCIFSSPEDLQQGDNIGMAVPVRPDGNAMACSVTRSQDCGSVRYSPGSCYRSTNYGNDWEISEATKSLSCPILHVEVLFVLDGSKSVGDENFETVKRWVKSISQKIGLERESVSVGVVQYSHYYSDKDINNQPYIVTDIEIDEHQTYATFAAAVDDISLHGYTTYTGEVLRKVQTDFKGTKNYGQNSTKQVMILLTDGIATDRDSVARNAQKLRDIGVIPYAVGVGTERDVNRTELRLIASGDPYNDTRVFMAANFAGLDTIAKELEAEIGELILEGETKDNGTGYETEFGETGFSIAYSRAADGSNSSTYGVIAWID